MLELLIVTVVFAASLTETIEPPALAVLLSMLELLIVTVVVSAAPLTETIEPPAPAVLLSMLELLIVTVVVSAAPLTATIEPPTPAVLLSILELLIVTVVAAAPLTEIAVAPLTFLTSTLLRTTVTSAGASTETALTAVLLESKITLSSVVFEFEQIMHVPPDEMIMTLPLLVVPSIARALVMAIPLDVTSMISGAKAIVFKASFPVFTAVIPRSKVLSPPTIQSTASADWTWLSDRTPPKKSALPRASLLFEIE